MNFFADYVAFVYLINSFLEVSQRKGITYDIFHWKVSCSDHRNCFWPHVWSKMSASDSQFLCVT